MESDETCGACMFCASYVGLGSHGCGVCMVAVSRDVESGEYDGLSIQDIIECAMAHDVDGWNTPCERYEEV